nr:glycosyltransferase family 1 protein [Sulfurospirillum sp. 'SP']
MLTGIQRVVYNILDELQQEDYTKEQVQPIVLSSRGFLPITSLNKHRYMLSHNNFKQQQKYLTFFKNINFRKIPKLYQLMKYVFFMRKRLKTAYVISEPSIRFTKGDIVLFLDSSWNLPMWKEVKKAKKAEAKIVFVIYDFIPMLFPQFCEKAHSKQFELFFRKSLVVADQYIGISKTVMNDISSLAADLAPEQAKKIQYDYFYLGANFSKENQEVKKIREEIIEFFNTKIPILLTVSTIEPRKNHALILDAFEKLIQENVSVKLCFIGKIGWKVESFMKRIENHPLLKKDFLVIHDANDTELLYAYQKSFTLVFASTTEGFGLPIIEALNYNLPVIASDIKIHREIGQNQITYFQDDNIQDLTSQIKQILLNPKKISCSSWLTWKESARMLFDKLK